MFRTLPPRAFKLGTRTLRRGQAVNLDQLLEAWVGFGYESTTTVLAPGEFSRRGGIVDVYPPALARPVRIEFFGDEVDSLRAFDPAYPTLARCARTNHRHPRRRMPREKRPHRGR